MRPVPPQLHGLAFTPGEAARFGVTPRMLQGARFTQVLLGVWRTSATVETEELRIRAALKVLPRDAALSHISNVRLRGLDVGLPTPLHFSTASGVHVEREGLVVHRRQVRLHSQLLRGVPVLDAARTFVDVATDVDDRSLLRIGDWLVRQRQVDLLELRAFAIAEHLDGVQRARRVAPLLRDRVDSVRESDVRWIIHAAGLPVPEANPPIMDGHGVQVAKGDLVYPEWKVLVEHDGWHHERDANQRQRDHLRRELLVSGLAGHRDHRRGLQGRASDRVAGLQRAGRTWLHRSPSPNEMWPLINRSGSGWSQEQLPKGQISAVSGRGAGDARGP